jgi:hypothetical protein
MIKSVEQDY